MDDWKIKDAVAHLKLAAYLVRKADERGLTHGEKHHLLTVVSMELATVAAKLGETSLLITRLDISDAPSDIPF